MTSLLEPAGPRRAVAGASALAIGRPGPGEIALAGLTLFLLAFGLPQEWFIRSSSLDVGGRTGGSVVIVVFGGLTLLLLSRLVGHEIVLVELIRREPFLMLLPVVAVASTVWAADPGTAFRRAVAFLLATLLGYYYASRFEPRQFVLLMATFMAFGLVLNLLFIFGLPAYGRSGAGDFSGVHINKNTLGRVAALAAVMSLLATRIDRPRRALWWTVTAVQLFVLVGANSKTSLAAFSLTVALLIVYAAFRARDTLYGAVALGLVISVSTSLLVALSNLEVIADVLDRDVTLTGRTDLWALVLDRFDDALPLGFGWNSFWGPYLSPAHEIYLQTGWSPPNAHNDLMDLWLALGPLGPLLYLAFMIRGLVRGTRFLRLHPTAEGLWPLVTLSIVLLIGITESGIAERNIHWVTLVVAVSYVTSARAEDLAAAAGRRVNWRAVGPSPPPSGA